jgi:hypothetical protein
MAVERTEVVEVEVEVEVEDDGESKYIYAQQPNRPSNGAT